MNGDENMKYIDFRSDTVTEPTEKMRKAMYNAEVGDDVYGDDVTVNRLEKEAAYKLGKEAALFVPSGTFGNQLALFTHVNRGEEVILGDQCHIVQHEAGASAYIAGAQLRTVNAPYGRLNINEIDNKIRKTEDIHYPKTALICIENAHSSGYTVPLENMSEIYNLAEKYNLKVHLDGARIFNAATALGCDVKDITKYADSVMFCLSKGLCAPVGSILTGEKEFIDMARKKRKIMGGGLRQSGIIAAAGIVALEEMTERLSEDHENAVYLSEKLSLINALEVDRESIHINMVFFRVKQKYNCEDFTGFLLKNGIKISSEENGYLRFVTHYWIDKNKIDYTAEKIKEYFAER